MPVFPTTTATTSTTLAGPELIPIMFACPSGAPARAGIAVDFGVKNFGTATAVGPWWDYVLWSTDQNFGGDTAIFGYQRVANLAAGAQYTPTTQTVNLPNVAAGTYYLYFQTDGANAVPEGNDLNNIIGPVAITISNADLIPTVLTPPASANAGATIQIAYSIKNQGAGSAIGPWNDTLYLSTDMAFGGDTVLGTFAESVAGVGGTYNRNQTVIIPNVAPGTYYVFLEAETGNQIYESNEGNNRKGPVAITIN
jgi:subtilase family serine protease